MTDPKNKERMRKYIICILLYPCHENKKLATALLEHIDSELLYMRVVVKFFRSYELDTEI